MQRSSQRSSFGQGAMRRSSSAGGRPSLVPLRVKNGSDTGGSTSKSKSRVTHIPTSTGRNSRDSRSSFGSIKKRPRSSSAGLGPGKQSRLSSAHIGGGGHHDQMKDPRPIGDRAFKEHSIRQLIEFLQEEKYPHQLSLKLLQIPTTKDFIRIWEFLNSFFVPDYKLGNKIEEEVPRMLRAYGYPFPIPKTAMYTVGTQHTWPTLLAALCWLKDTIKMMLAQNIDDLMFPLTETADFDTMPEEKVVYEYVETAYHAFLEGTDDFEVYEKDLEAKLRDNLGRAGGNLEELESRKELLQKELLMLETQPDILHERTNLMETLRLDLEKMSQYKGELEAHFTKQEKDVKATEEEVTQLDAELLSLRQDTERKERILATQEFSPADVERINRGRAELLRNIASLERECQDVDSRGWAAEITVSKLHEKLEVLCRDFNQTASALQLIPASAENANGVDYEMRPALSHHGHMLTTIKPALQQIKAQFGERMNELFEKMLAEEEALEQATDMLHDKEEEVRLLEWSNQRAEEQLSAAKENLSSAVCTYEKDIEQLRLELATMKKPSAVAGGSSSLLYELRKDLTDRKSSHEKVQKQNERQLKLYMKFVRDATAMIVAHKEEMQNEAAKMADQAAKRLEMVKKMDEDDPL